MRRLTVAVVLIASAGCGPGNVPTANYFSGEPVAHWLEAARSPDAKTRKKAVGVLGNVGPADPDAIPALIAAVADKDSGVRDAAVLGLSKIGPPAAAAADALREATRDPSKAVRDHAAVALDRVTGVR